MSKRSRGQAALDKYNKEYSKKRGDAEKINSDSRDLSTENYNDNDDESIIVDKDFGEVEEKLNNLYNIFRSLDLIIHSFKLKNVPARWPEVVESFNRVSGLSIDLTDLSIIIHICPSLYQINWKIFNEKGNRQPSIDLVLWIPINHENGLERKSNLIIQKRLLQFRNCINDYAQLLSSNTWSNFVLSVEKKNPIPPRPSKETIQNSMNNSNKSDQDFRRIVKEVVTSLEKKENFTVVGVMKESKSLEELALLASSRGNDSKLHEEKQRLQKTANEQLAMLQRLPSLAIVVRSHFHLHNRNSMTLSDCLAKISKDLKTSSRESKETLVLFTQVVPEFVAILPSDRVCMQETVSVNRQTSFRDISAKLVQLIETEVGKRSQ